MVGDFAGELSKSGWDPTRHFNDVASGSATECVQAATDSSRKQVLLNHLMLANRTGGSGRICFDRWIPSARASTAVNWWADGRAALSTARHLKRYRLDSAKGWQSRSRFHRCKRASPQKTANPSSPGGTCNALQCLESVTHHCFVRLWVWLKCCDLLICLKHETSHLKAYGSWRSSPIFQALLFFECGLCSHLEAAKSAETHRSRQKYQKSLITTWKENRRGTHGGGDVHIVEMCFFALSDQNVSICSSTFTSQAPKMLLSTKVPKPIEKTKNNKKTKSFTPCPLSSFSDPLYGWKLFFGGSRGFCHFVSPTMSVAHFLGFCFPVSWAPGRNFHPDKHSLAQLSPLHILYWCLHWATDFGYWAIRENVQ